MACEWGGSSSPEQEHMESAVPVHRSGYKGTQIVGTSVLHNRSQNIFKHIKTHLLLPWAPPYCNGAHWRPDGAKLDLFVLFNFLCFLILVLCFHNLFGFFFECFLLLTYKRLRLEVALQSSSNDEWEQLKSNMTRLPLTRTNSNNLCNI